MEGLIFGIFWMCIECLSALRRGALLRFLLANNLWIGNIPFELRRLTIPEELLIARYPRCIMVELHWHPSKEHTNLASDQLYTEFAGNLRAAAMHCFLPNLR